MKTTLKKLSYLVLVLFVFGFVVACEQPTGSTPTPNEGDNSGEQNNDGDNNGGGEETPSVVDKYLQISYTGNTTADPASWHAQFQGKPSPEALPEGNYTFSFRAKASRDQVVSMNITNLADYNPKTYIQDSNEEWVDTVELTSDWQDFSASFEVTAAEADAENTFVFYIQLGALEAIDVMVDSFKLVDADETEYMNQTTFEGVTVTDDSGVNEDDETKTDITFTGKDPSDATVFVMTDNGSDATFTVSLEEHPAE